MKIVVALGGNALLKKGEQGNIYQQFANTRESVADIVTLINEGHSIVITHGNGPQVGNILRRVEIAKDEAYYLPLGVCVAESQGEIGYMISQTIKNSLKKKGVNKEVICILTQVLCDKDDPSMKKPSKPIGSYYTKYKAMKLKKGSEKRAVFREDSGRGYRRFVPSPEPKAIIESPIIKKLMNSAIVIACGGGGMPVYKENGIVEGIDGVIDKDLSSALLATELKADILAILTSVEFVYKNFGKPNQKKLGEISLTEAKQLLKEGHFGEGSMEPKIQAAVNFLSKGGKKVIITGTKNLCDALEGKTGTIIE